MYSGRICERVVGFGSTQHVVTNTIFFRRDCKAVIVKEVKEIRKAVVGTCKVLFDKVIITGRLRKAILIREFSACNSNLAAVADVEAEVAFTTAIEVRGARPGDQCVMVQAFVEGEVEEPFNVTPQGGFSGIVDTSVIFLCVKVLRTGGSCGSRDSGGAMSDVTGIPGGSGDSDESGESERDDSDGSGSGGSSSSGGSGGSGGSGSARVSASKRPCDNDQESSGSGERNGGCPKRRSTGAFPGAGGAIPAPLPGAVPGSFVGPTGTFAGVTSGLHF